MTLLDGASRPCFHRGHHEVCAEIRGWAADGERAYLPGQALEHPEKPFVAILGGAKVSDKIPVIQNLLDKVDAHHHRRRHGVHLPESPGQTSWQVTGGRRQNRTCQPAVAGSQNRKLKFLLPIDHVVADKLDANAAIRIIDGDQPIPADLMALDIGPKTVELSRKRFLRAHHCLNGPMGVFELAPFC